MLEIVIKIPEKIYKNIQSENFWLDSGLTLSNAYDFIRNGTPIPKGHGKILDEKDILDIENNDVGWYDLVDMPEYIAGVKAIIEADKEYKNETD